MKKLLVLCLLAIGGVVFSQNMDSIAGMIKFDLFGKADQISEISKNLSDTQKLMLYTECKKDPGVPFALNLLVGFGVGSFAQGDFNRGVASLGWSLLGLLLVNINWHDSVVKQVSEYTGYGMIAVTRIWGLVIPFEYSERYNKKLKESLRYPE